MAGTEDTDALALAYVEGEMDASAARAFEARLAGDPALRAEVDGLRAMKELLGADARFGQDSRIDAPPAHLVDAIMNAEALARPAEIRQAAALQRNPPPTLTAKLARWLLGGGALVAGATVVVFSLQHRTLSPDEALAPSSVAEAPPVEAAKQSAPAPSGVASADAPAPDAPPSEAAPSDAKPSEPADAFGGKLAESAAADEAKGASMKAEAQAEQPGGGLVGGDAFSRAVSNAEPRAGDGAGGAGAGFDLAQRAQRAEKPAQDPAPPPPAREEEADDDGARLDRDGARAARPEAKKTADTSLAFDGEAERSAASGAALGAASPRKADETDALEKASDKKRAVPATRSMTTSPPATPAAQPAPEPVATASPQSAGPSRAGAAPAKPKPTSQEDARKELLERRLADKSSRRARAEAKDQAPAKAKASKSSIGAELESPEELRAAQEAELAFTTGLRELQARRYGEALVAFQNAERLDRKRALGVSPIVGQMRCHAAFGRLADVARLSGRLLPANLKSNDVVDGLVLGADAAEKTGDTFLAEQLYTRLLEVPAQKANAERALARLRRPMRNKALESMDAAAETEAPAAAAPAESR